jgi:hypothetical protein
VTEPNDEHPRRMVDEAPSIAGSAYDVNVAADTTPTVRRMVDGIPDSVPVARADSPPAASESSSSAEGPSETASGRAN